MLVKRLEAERDNVIGLVPVYTDTGNATEVWLNTGEVFIDSRGIKAVRANLARSYAIDLKAQRLQVGTLLNRKGPLPFYIGKRVFIPLKLRQAVTDNDMVYGFLDISYVKSLEPLEKGTRCEAVMPEGKRIRVLSHYNTALAAKQTGERLADLLDLKRSNSGEDEVVKSVAAFIGNINEISRRLERIEDKITESGINREVKEED